MEKLIVDGLVLLVFVATVIYFGKQGFARTVLTATVSIGAIVVAWIFGKPVGAFLDTAFLQGGIVDMVHAGLEKIAQYAAQNMSASQIMEQFPEYLRQLLGYVNLDAETLVANVLSGVDLEALSHQIGEPVSAAVAGGLGIVITYIVAFVALKIAAAMVDGIFHLPILNSLNGLMGAVLGAAIGFCFCLLFANLFHTVAVLLSADHAEMARFILPEGSVLYRWLLELHF